jgi:SNF2 family DNA or RNA helicase
MPSLIYESMRDYQRTGAHFMRRAGNPLLADQPGLGKTMQALGTILADAKMSKNPDRRRKHLVVCPKVAIRNVWEPEIQRWLADQKVEILALDGSVAEREQMMREFRPKDDTQHIFVLTNIESVRIKPVPDDLPKTRKNVFRYAASYKGEKTKMVYAPENGVIPALFEHTWDTIICDESHRALIVTKVSQPNQTRAGFTLLRSRRRIALSGTPMRGKPEQLWGTLNWLRPDEYRSYWNWVKTYFNLTSNGFSNYLLAGFKPGGENRMADDLKRVMLRRTKAEVVPELPAKTYAGSHLIPGDDQSPLGIWLDMSPAQRKSYDKLMTEALVGDDITVDGPLALYTRQRQLAGAVHKVEGDRIIPTLDSPKYEWLTEWLDENEGEKVVVVSQFTSLIEAFAKGLTDAGHSVATLTGKTSDKKRNDAVKRFQETDEIRVFMLNTRAGGVALTLDAADYVVFLDETTIPDEQEQAEDRVHRVSRMHNVTIYHHRCLDTIEEEVAWIAAARQDVQTYLLDGARGVEFAKKVYLASRGTKEGKTA